MKLLSHKLQELPSEITQETLLQGTLNFINYNCTHLKCSKEIFPKQLINLILLDSKDNMRLISLFCLTLQETDHTAGPSPGKKTPPWSLVLDIGLLPTITPAGNNGK